MRSQMVRRVTVLFPITDLARDGAQRQLFELVKGLDRQRFRPLVVALRAGGGMEPEFSSALGSDAVILKRDSRIDDLRCVSRIASVIGKNKVDVIQPFLTPATFYSLVAARGRRPVVKIVTERASAGRTVSRPGYGLLLRVEDALSRSADVAVANSKAGAEFLVKRGIRPERVRVIYNGLNLERLTCSHEEVELVRRRLNVPTGGKVIGMAARMFPQKRHDIFLRAAAIVSAQLPETRFAIVGEGPLKDSLIALSRDLGIASQVFFLGEQARIAPFVSAFDVAALISDAEGCSNSVLEAMALGKPVVATDIGGNPELVRDGETGFLVCNRVNDVADAMLKLVHDPSIAHCMGLRGKSLVAEGFSLSSMVEQYETIYEETTQRQRAL